jgi:hypothetical protein
MFTFAVGVVTDQLANDHVEIGCGKVRLGLLGIAAVAEYERDIQNALRCVLF